MEQKRLKVAIQQELEEKAEKMKDRLFKDTSYAEMYRQLISRGLAEAERKKDGAQDDRTA